MGYEFEQKEYPLYTQIGTFYSRDEIRKWLSDSTQRLVYCEDYAYFIFGLLTLYQSTFAPRYLQEAVRLQRGGAARRGQGRA